MSEQTYGGHTLAEIKAAAEAATPGPYELRATSWSYYAVQAANPVHGAVLDVPPSRKADLDHAIAANPSTVLALVARLEELELVAERNELLWQGWKEKAKRLERDHTAALRLVAEVRHACGDDGKRMLPELVQYVGELAKDAGRHRLEGWRAAREQASSLCMTQDVHPVENARLRCYRAIGAMQPPAEWAMPNPFPLSADEVESSMGSLRAHAQSTCWCHACRPVSLDDMRMVLCPECGNKRCPHANDHRNACTSSNEPGQAGSACPATWPHPDGFAGGLTERETNK